jgi:hypothetical protein
MYSVLQDEHQGQMDDFEDPNSPTELGVTVPEERKMFATDFDAEFLKADLVSIASTSMNRGFGQKSTQRRKVLNKIASPNRQNSRKNRNQSTQIMSESKYNCDNNSMLYDLLQDYENNNKQFDDDDTEIFCHTPINKSKYKLKNPNHEIPTGQDSSF